MERLQNLDAAFVEANALGGPLRDRLAALQDALAELTPAVDRAYSNFVAKLEAQLAGDASPKVGEALPDFLLPNDAGGLTSLADAIETGPAIISFNRGHWCHHCMLELFSLAAIHRKVEERGGTITSIVPEKQKFTRGLKAKCELPFPVLSDIDHSFAMATGLVVSVMSDLRDVYLDHGVDLSVFQGTESWLLPIPATFIVDRHGIIAARFIDPDFRRRMEPDQILSALEKIE